MIFNFQSVTTERVLARTYGSGGGGNNKNKKQGYNSDRSHGLLLLIQWSFNSALWQLRHTIFIVSADIFGNQITKTETKVEQW